MAAEHGWVLVCGGLSGAGRAAVGSCRMAGGLTIALPPQDEDESGAELVLPTRLGVYRNFLLAHAADAGVAVGGGTGTLQETSQLHDLGRPVAAIAAPWSFPGLRVFADYDALESAFLDPIEQQRKRNPLGANFSFRDEREQVQKASIEEKLVLLMYQSWTNLDQAIEGLSARDATVRQDGDSSIAWTVGHVTHMVDSWLNVRFQGLSPHPVFSADDFRTGGSGEASDWERVLAAVRDVRETAKRFLDAAPSPALDLTIPYDGSILFLRPFGLRLSYALVRIAAHHFMHAGEILTIRSQLGHKVADAEQDWGRALA